MNVAHNDNTPIYSERGNHIPGKKYIIISWRSIKDFSEQLFNSFIESNNEWNNGVYWFCNEIEVVINRWENITAKDIEEKIKAELDRKEKEYKESPEYLALETKRKIEEIRVNKFEKLLSDLKALNEYDYKGIYECITKMEENTFLRKEEAYSVIRELSIKNFDPKNIKEWENEILCKLERSDLINIIKINKFLTRIKPIETS